MVEDGSRRHWRAVGSMALAVVVMAAVGFVYLRPSTASTNGLQPPADFLQAQIGPESAPSLPSVPRSKGIVRPGPSGLMLEQIGGLNDHPPESLKQWVEVRTETTLSKLVRELNALPAFPDGMPCPMNDGSYYELTFQYADQTAASVKVEAGGCGSVFVGDSTQPMAWTATSPAVMVTLTGLFAHRPSGY